MHSHTTTGPYQEDRKQIQEVIYYMTSRLRAASIHILNSGNVKKNWMDDILSIELVMYLIK